MPGVLSTRLCTPTPHQGEGVVQSRAEPQGTGGQEEAARWRLGSTIEERTWSREHFDDPAIEYLIQRWLTWAPPGRGRRQVGKRRQATWQAAADKSVGAAAELQGR